MTRKGNARNAVNVRCREFEVPTAGIGTNREGSMSHTLAIVQLNLETESGESLRIFDGNGVTFDPPACILRSTGDDGESPRQRTSCALMLAMNALRGVVHSQVLSIIREAHDACLNTRRPFSVRSECVVHNITSKDVADIETTSYRFQWERDGEFAPAISNTVHMLFNSTSPDVSFRVIEKIRPGDIIILSSVEQQQDLEMVDVMEPDSMHALIDLLDMDHVLTTLFGNDGPSRRMTTLLVIRPVSGWVRVRRIIRMRTIVIFWLFSTVSLMAPGGTARERDRNAYEMDV